MSSRTARRQALRRQLVGKFAGFGVYEWRGTGSTESVITSDFFEIDFLDVESAKSGDAIPLRYQLNGFTTIHVVDGGFQDTGEKIVSHIKQYYDNPRYIDRVIVTHPDGDHDGGLRSVLEEFEVVELWMLRPWLYADDIIHRFTRFSSVYNLQRCLKEIYSNIEALEDIAIHKGITIREPFQGERIGAFTVMAPTKERYLDLIVESERTPEAIEHEEDSRAAMLRSLLERAGARTISLLKAVWGAEVFSPEETSAENEMSVVQYANLCGRSILLTGDAGRAGLLEAADFTPHVGLILPGIDRFQIPHHGSRRNVSTEILDRWLGRRLPSKPAKGDETFTAFISASAEDNDHPRKAVVRAAMHRGARVVTTEGNNLRSSQNAPEREEWYTAKLLEYPEEQED